MNNQQSTISSDQHQNETTETIEQSVSVNTSIMIRPYAEYFTRKEESNGFLRLVRKNWGQMSILWPGILLLCGSTSAHLFWTVWEITRFHYSGMDIRNGILYAWYFGAIIGFMAGAGLNNVWTKKWIYYFAGVILAVSGLFYIFHLCSEYYLHLARILSGAVYGITYTTILQHASDNSSPQFRRCVILFLSVILSTPIIFITYCIKPFLVIVEETTARNHIAIGVVTLILSVLALIVMPCTKDSIVFQISSSKDLQALQCLYEIRNEPRQSIRSDFNEFKLMVAQDCYDGGHLLRDGNARPLFWILSARVLCALVSNNLCITIFFMEITKVFGDFETETFSHENAFTGYPLLIFQMVKLLVGIGVLLAVNKFSCNTNPPFCFYMTAFLLGTINLTISITMAVNYASEDGSSIISTYILMWILHTVNILFVSISFGIDTFGYIQLSEGFSVAKRSWSIAAISIAETLVHMVYIFLLTHPFKFYFNYIHSIFIMICSYCLICFMPNYHLFEVISLKQARHKFKN